MVYREGTTSSDYAGSFYYLVMIDTLYSAFALGEAGQL